MADSRILKTSFDKYFADSLFKQADQSEVMVETQRAIQNQIQENNGLSIAEMDISKCSLDFPNQSIREYFSQYRHHGSFPDTTHAYYSIAAHENGYDIPGSINYQQNKKQHYFLQQDDSVIYLEQFDIPVYFEKQIDSDGGISQGPAIQPSRPHVPIARLLTVSHIIPGNDKVEEHHLILHKIFVMDEQTGNVLFPKDHFHLQAHLQKCYDKSIKEVQDEIDEITSPFKFFGVLTSFNQYSCFKITMPTFSRQIEWKKVTCEKIDNILWVTDWIQFYKLLNGIKWDIFAGDIISIRFAKHYQMAITPEELPRFVEKEEVEALKESLDKYKIHYSVEWLSQLNTLKQSAAAITEFFKLQNSLKKTFNDFNSIESIITNILQKIVTPKKDKIEYQNKYTEFNSVCGELYLLVNKQDDNLFKAGYALYHTLQEIKKTTSFSTDELAELNGFVALSKLLMENLQKDNLHLGLAEGKWSYETCCAQVKLYEQELKKFSKKYQPSTALPKVATAVGGVTAGLSAAGGVVTSVPAVFIPAAISSLVAVGPIVFVPPLAAGALALGAGIFVLNKAEKRKLRSAGALVLQELTINLEILKPKEKKRQGFWG